MIVLSAPIQQDQIIDLLTNYHENDISFQFIKKEGIKLYFESNIEANEQTPRLVKDIIKSTPWGSVLFFQVVVE